MNCRLLGTSCFVTIALSHSCPVPAQRSATSQPIIEDIIVTAQKRSERTQDVPIAITALTAGDLAGKGVQNTYNLPVAVPGLVYNSITGSGQTYLRGVGTSLSVPNTDATVATYVDGVYISNPYGSILNLLGVDRIEVLKGPQGTLYGRNATAGAIGIYTLTPGQKTDVRLSTSFGNYKNIEGSGQLSGPITDNLSVGLYFTGGHRDTYLKLLKVGAHRGEPDGESFYAARVKAVWEPTETFKLTASADSAFIKSVERAANLMKSPNAAGVAAGGIVDIRPYHFASDAPSFARIRQKGVSLRSDLNLGWANLVTITGIRKTNVLIANEVDGTTAPLVAGGARQRTNQFSEEIQLVSPESSSIQWIVGAFYFRDYSGFNPRKNPTIEVSNASYVNVLAHSYAAFGQATAPLSFIDEKLRLTLGGRYTKDQKRRINSFEVLSNNRLEELGPRTLYPILKRTWNQFTPKITIDYRMSKTLLYATYSVGYKSGAFNTIGGNIDNAVDPEKLRSFEVGSKSDFFDRRLRLNTAAFAYKYRNLQSQTVTIGNTGAPSTLIQNAASATFYGIEATLDLALTNSLSLKTGGIWEKGKYGTFLNYNGNVSAPVAFKSTPLDVSGNHAERLPRFTGSLGANYKRELDNGSSIIGDVTWYYNSGYFWNPQNDFRQPAYNLVNASIGYAAPENRWSVTIWSNNLTNTYYRNTLAVTGVGLLASDAPPRMYGVRIGIKY